MAKTKSLPTRAQVKKSDTWDLTKLFSSDAAWERAFKKLEGQVDQFPKFKGKLGKSAKILRECFDFETEFEQLAEKLGSYAFLNSAGDIAESHYQGMVARYTHLATLAGEAASFIAPEIQAIPKKKLEAFMRSATLKPYRIQLERLLRFRPHILSQKEERLLAMQGEVAGTASKVFRQLTDADFSFGFVKNEKGERVELTHGSYRVFMESPERHVRKEAFNKYCKVYEDHENTLAATLSSSVLQDVYGARVRNYPSVLEGALFPDNVPMSVYDSLVSSVRANLGTLHRYMELRGRALGIRSVHMYDAYVPIVNLRRQRIPYAQAVDDVCNSLKPLGAAYCNPLRKGLEGRWVDRYENKGKRSGAFSAGSFEGPPYILMNYEEDVLDSVFTLAHEAGHSMHTYHSVRSQPYQDWQYSIFAAEVASTFNEQLLHKYLLDRAKCKKMRAYLINSKIDEIRGTIIRQCMFAEYERILHAIAEAGEPLTLERLTTEYRTLLEVYFGPKFVIDEVLGIEGMRIPHFYRAFYVYKYATGLSAAIALSQMVLNGGAKERDRYLSFLRSGGSKFPLDQLREAGVDLEKPQPVDRAMSHFKELVDELEELL